MRAASKAAIALAALAPQLSQAVSLDVSDPSSVRSAASIIAYGLMKYYTGNVTDTPDTLGILPSPYYWWEAGAMWGAMLDYYHYTGDSTYNDVTTQALLSQVGPDYDYMVPRQQNNEGNDDQAFWGFATMSAAEKGYPEPTTGGYSWVQLTENLWNTQVRRWDTSTCNGGLRWQIFSSNAGYNYKNSVSNGAFFQLSARLARFTGNQTYVEWAEKSLSWSQGAGLVDSAYQVFDGAQDTQNCAVIDKIVWTYNTGIYLYGSAVMYNYTNGASYWETQTQGFLSAAKNFFSPFPNSTNIMYEPACETIDSCDNDQYSFKAYLSRFMWDTTQLAPFSTSAVTTYLQASSKAAANACSGGADGVTCGEHWYYGAYDGKYGVGQQLSALETIQGLLIQDSAPPIQGGEAAPTILPSTSTAPTSSSTYSRSISSSSQVSLSSTGAEASRTLGPSEFSSSISSNPPSVLSSTITSSNVPSSTEVIAPSSTLTTSSSLTSKSTLSYNVIASDDASKSGSLSLTTSCSSLCSSTATLVPVETDATLTAVSLAPTSTSTTKPKKNNAGRDSGSPWWMTTNAAVAMMVMVILNN